MDNKIMILAAVVTVSGCTHMTGPLTPPSGPSGSGLQVETLDISDGTVSSGQTALITLELKNYHRQEINIDDISLYNTGILETEKQGCNPPPARLETARKDYIPEMRCRWTLQVPEEEVENFNSKMVPVKLNLAYRSQLSNSEEPIKLHFQPLEDIEQKNELTKTFSNEEVRLQIKTESPIQLEGSTATITANNAGNGRVDSDYSFEYSPSTVFPDCPQQKEPLINQEVEFACSIDPQTDSSLTRNLIVSTSYKYVKEPTIDVEVVNR
ncbi:MAG: hypothetical protein BRC29_01055 [Nanohaloarchaea archaeon SW_7_43_1]|nr:MAG: hypothetical protein BRC29_01055 [Nanohaloarchaea archaeon SW_7_43_1]